MTVVNPFNYLPGSRKLWLVLAGLLVLISVGVHQAVVRYRNTSYLNLLLGCTPVHGWRRPASISRNRASRDPSAGRTGSARLLVPANPGHPPERLWISIETYRPRAKPIRLQILVDESIVFDGQAKIGKWEKSFNLGSRQFSDKVMIKIRSDTFVPKGVMDRGETTTHGCWACRLKALCYSRTRVSKADQVGVLGVITDRGQAQDNIQIRGSFDGLS